MLYKIKEKYFSGDRSITFDRSFNDTLQALRMRRIPYKKKFIYEVFLYSYGTEQYHTLFVNTLKKCLAFIDKVTGDNDNFRDYEDHYQW